MQKLTQIALFGSVGDDH